MQVFFLFFCTFFQYNLKTTYFQGLRTFAILPEAISAGGDWLPSLIPACFSPPIEAGVISQLILSDKRKSTTSAHVVLFLFGMSLRGFPRCIAVCYYIQSWGMLLRRGSIYINWSLPLQDCSWGKQPATA